MSSAYQYQPPRWARNTNLQSILATFKLRRHFVEKRAAAVLAVSDEVILDCGEGVRLQGFYSPNKSNGNVEDVPLVILIHGWEGSHKSMYLLSSAQSLFAQGYSVFRLNLRDHGDSHHLNEELFHSCRLDEVVRAVKVIQDTYPHKRLCIAGFSLGGNFALRVASKAHEYGIELDKAAAVCPPIDPNDTLLKLRDGSWLYKAYFMYKWRRSLKKKAAAFPDIYDVNEYAHLKDLGEMTEALLSRFGDFASAEEYFDGYALKGDCLKDLRVPSFFLLAKDDPMIDHQGAELIANNDQITIVKTQYGGHCGFLKNRQLHSWADEGKKRTAGLLRPRSLLLGVGLRPNSLHCLQQGEELIGTKAQSNIVFPTESLLMRFSNGKRTILLAVSTF